MASRSWNKVELMGNLTRDPELRFTPNGAAVCTFGMATNRTYTQDGEKKEEVDFHRLVAWNKLAELCNQLLKKGSKVFISGRLQYREWEGQDGQKRRDTEIVVEDMIVLTPKASGGEDYSYEQSGSATSSKATETPKSEESQSKPVTQETANEKVDETVTDDLPF